MRHLKISTFQEKQKTDFFLTPPTFIFLAWMISNRCFSWYVSICKLIWKLLVCKIIAEMCLCRILCLCFCKSKTDIITCRVLYIMTVRSKTDINPMSCFDLIFMGHLACVSVMCRILMLLSTIISLPYNFCFFLYRRNSLHIL